jgi:hypothetical protein
MTVEEGRATRKNVKLFPSYPEKKGWRVARLVSYEQAERKEDEGSWRRLNDPLTGALIGFEIIAVNDTAGDEDVRSMRSSASISSSEMEVNAGARFFRGDRSRTVGSSEDRRAELAAMGRAPEDRAERVQAKVAVYAHVGAAKGDILRVWPRGENRPPLA